MKENDSYNRSQHIKLERIAGGIACIDVAYLFQAILIDSII